MSDELVDVRTPAWSKNARLELGRGGTEPYLTSISSVRTRVRCLSP